MLGSLKARDFSFPFIIWVIIVCWYFLFVFDYFDALRIRTQDFFTSQSFYLFSSPPPVNKRIVIVAIDETSRAYLNLKWPWRRSVTAKLIRKIASFSPEVIGLDIIFSGESQEDEELISALKSHPRIVLAYILKSNAKELPLKSFREAVNYLGFINKPMGIGNVVRETRTFYIDKHREVYFSIDIELAASFLNTSPEEIKRDDKGIYLANKIFIPSKIAVIPINYSLHPNDFDTIPAYLILNNKADPKIFKDKIVLIGATDPLIHDEFLTPLGVFPGVTIIGNSLAMILSQRFIYNVPLWLNILIIFVLGTLIILINRRLSFGLSSLLSFLALLSTFIIFLYLRARDIQLDYFTFFSLIFSSYIVANIYKYSHLIYVSNKLKKIGITDTLTGFYTSRYFFLKLDEELKDKSKSLIFLAIVASGYRRLILDLDFEEVKNLIKLLADYIESRLRSRFRKTFLCRLSEDMFGIAIFKGKKEKVEVFLKELLRQAKQIEFKVEDKTVKVSFKAILIYKPKGVWAQSQDIIYNMDVLQKQLKTDIQREYICMDLTKEIWGKKRSNLKYDILDFLISDSEERNKEMESSLKQLLESKKETEEAYFEAIRSLIKALEEKDTYTQGHSERVANYALAIAKEAGLPEEECDLIYKASLLHDIGKIGIPDYILHKKEKLTEEEVNLIKKHEVMSVEILNPIKPFKDLLPIILHHHEHFDGTGYPYGLSGDMIPKGAQILAVADAFDAISCGRGYKRGSSVKEAIEELEKNRGTQFNPLYVEALKKSLI
jgi:putative nucleotidyltransferase with HDIG domain